MREHAGGRLDSSFLPARQIYYSHRVPRPGKIALLRQPLDP